MQINPLGEFFGGGSEWTVVNSNLRYRIIGGVVYVYVRTGTAGTWESTGFIPSEIAPEENIYQTYYSDGSNNFSIATIDKTGNVLTLATLTASGIFSYPLK